MCTSGSCWTVVFGDGTICFAGTRSGRAGMGPAAHRRDHCGRFRPAVVDDRVARVHPIRHDRAHSARSPTRKVARAAAEPPDGRQFLRRRRMQRCSAPSRSFLLARIRRVLRGLHLDRACASVRDRQLRRSNSAASNAGSCRQPRTGTTCHSPIGLSPVYRNLTISPI